MLEGALYKELGEEEYALQVSDQITPNRKCLIKQKVPIQTASTVTWLMLPEQWPNYSKREMHQQIPPT